MGKEEEHIHPDDDKSETCKEPAQAKGPFTWRRRQ